jgi:hypothetical protein
VIDEVVGEQLVEQGEISLALDLFGVAADHRLEGFTVVSHLSLHFFRHCWWRATPC